MRNGWGKRTKRIRKSGKGWYRRETMGRCEGFKQEERRRKEGYIEVLLYLGDLLIYIN